MSTISTGYSSGMHPLTCDEDGNISFDCPCTEGFQYCRFMKFGGGLIVRDGLLVDGYGEKYEVNGRTMNIKLKRCKKEDEGHFVSMCGGSDTNKQFEVKVCPTTKTSLTCKIGDEALLECPHCPEKLVSCKFEKIGEKVIVKNGLLNNNNNNSPYKFSNKYHLILQKCNVNDNGTYVWACDNHKHYLNLTIVKSRNPPLKMSVLVIFPISLILMIFLLGGGKTIKINPKDFA